MSRGKRKWIQFIVFVVIMLCAGFAAEQKTGKVTLLADEIQVYDLPVVVINTTNKDGLSLTKADGYVTADIAVTDPDGQITAEAGKVKVRGNSTAEAPKKPYTIKFDSKQNVLGMGSAKKWVLLANWFDKSFLRNYLALSLAAQLNLQYTSSCAFVDVYMDGQYMGNYLLTEQVEEGKNRVDIDSSNGDFLLEYELVREEEDVVYLNTPIYNYRFQINEPEEPTEEQLSGINRALKALETAISTNDMKEIAKVIDIDSFVDFYILNEYLKNWDFGYSSTRFYYKDGIFYAGPVWDYDISSGNTLEDDRGYDSADIWCGQIWYQQLMENKEFKNMCLNRFIGLQDTLKGLYEDNGFVDQAYDTYKEAFERDHVLAGWPQASVLDSSLTTVEKNVDALKNWLKERNEFLYDYWDCDSISVDYTGYYHAVEQARGLTSWNFSAYEDLRAALSVDLTADTVTQEDIAAATAKVLDAVNNGESIQPETSPAGAQQGHQLIHAAEKAVSCTSSGNKEYWYCIECGNYYTSEAALEPVAEEEVMLDMLGHSFTEYVSDNNADYGLNGTKTAHCDRCGILNTIPDSGSMLPLPLVVQQAVPTVGEALTSAGSTTESASEGRETGGTVTVGVTHIEVLADKTKVIVDGSGNRIRSKVVKLDGKKYITNKKGEVIVSAFATTPGGDKVYANAKGVIVTGRIFTVKGKKYVARKSGTIVKSAFTTTSAGYRVYSNKNGVVVTNKVFTVKGKKYIAAKSGKLITGKWVTKGKVKYYCNKKGVVTKTQEDS